MRLAASWEVFRVFLGLGCSSFGGPVAHIARFHDTLVHRRAWLDDAAYADLVALTQALPGPASSQTAMAIGLHRAGILGLVAAFLGFTLPSALLMAGAAAGVSALPAAAAPAVHGALVAVLAIVAHAVWSLWSRLCPDRPRQGLALLAAAGLLLVPGALGQLGVLVTAGLIGVVALPELPAAAPSPLAPTWRQRHGLVACAFIAGMGLLVLLLAAGPGARVVAAALTAGGLVFGGGHVVLPLLERAVVPTPLGADAFLAGYAAAQILPGPLFTFATYLGQAAGGPMSALLATIAIFLPGTAALLAALPAWSSLRQQRRLRRALAGINAAVVGLLIAAIVQPLLPATLRSDAAGIRDLALALLLFAALLCLRLPGWSAVLLGAAVAMAGW